MKANDWLRCQVKSSMHFDDAHYRANGEIRLRSVHTRWSLTSEIQLSLPWCWSLPRCDRDERKNRSVRLLQWANLHCQCYSTCRRSFWSMSVPWRSDSMAICLALPDRVDASSNRPVLAFECHMIDRRSAVQECDSGGTSLPADGRGRTSIGHSVDERVDKPCF